MTETSIQSAVPTQSRGRPPAASREDVLALAMHRYLRGRRIDVHAIAGELGLGRTTIYRWFGSRDELIGEVLVRAAEPLLEQARVGARGTGALALLDTLDRFNRSLADAPALRQFIENERDAALRVITSSSGRVQPRIVAMITALISAEVRAAPTCRRWSRRRSPTRWCVWRRHSCTTTPPRGFAATSIACVRWRPLCSA